MDGGENLKAGFLDASGVYRDAETVDLDKRDINFVGRRGYAITTSEINAPILAAARLYADYAVIAHNKNTGATGLVRLSPQQDVFRDEDQKFHFLNMEDMLTDISKDDNSEIEVHLVSARMSGDDESIYNNSKDIERLKEQIKEILPESNITFLSQNTQENPGPRHVAVDASRWNEGLIRGDYDATKGTDCRQKSEIVDFMKLFKPHVPEDYGNDLAQ